MSLKLIIFSGLPGAGKSTLAEAVGKQLSIPVFAKDWLEATLVRCELVSSTRDKLLGFTGYELLTTLAERVLRLEQSVILDSVAATVSIRSVWKQLAVQEQADWRVIECICSDESIHRDRLSKRERNIPGWYELEWSDVMAVKDRFIPWEEERLTLDMVNPLPENLSRALAYCSK